MCLVYLYAYIMLCIHWIERISIIAFTMLYTQIAVCIVIYCSVVYKIVYFVCRSLTSFSTNFTSYISSSTLPIRIKWHIYFRCTIHNSMILTTLMTFPLSSIQLIDGCALFMKRNDITIEIEKKKNKNCTQ